MRALKKLLYFSPSSADRLKRSSPDSIIGFGELLSHFTRMIFWMLTETLFVLFIRYYTIKRSNGVIPQIHLSILLMLAAKIAKAPCMRIQSSPYESALS